MKENLSSMEKLCRICLKEGANILIFDGYDENSVCHKLSLCLREKVEDLEGYPRNICTACFSILESVCSFIKKYKESYKVLESGLVPIKQEPFEDSCHFTKDNNDSDIEIDLIGIKTETDVDVDTKEILGEPLKLKIDKLKHLSIKRVKTPVDNETSKVANSISKNGKLKGKSIKKETKISLKDFKLRSRKLRLIKRQKELEHRRKTKSKVLKSKEPQEAPKSDKPQPPKLCDVCGDVFPTSDQLSYHKKKKHVDIPVQCPTCNRTCSSTYYLNRHIKRKHSENKEFICQICGRGFAFKGELTSHNKSVHVKKTGPPKTFSCKICGKTYKCRKSVVVHERSVHTGERPAVCTICDTSFTHEDYLKEHMRLHTGETPFKCPICGRGYAQRCNMKSHLRIHKVSELDAAALSELRPNYLRRLKV